MPHISTGLSNTKRNFWLQSRRYLSPYNTFSGFLVSVTVIYWPGTGHSLLLSDFGQMIVSPKYPHSLAHYYHRRFVMHLPFQIQLSQYVPLAWAPSQGFLCSSIWHPGSPSVSQPCYKPLVLHALNDWTTIATQQIVHRQNKLGDQANVSN